MSTNRSSTPTATPEPWLRHIVAAWISRGLHLLPREIDEVSIDCQNVLPFPPPNRPGISLDLFRLALLEHQSRFHCLHWLYTVLVGNDCYPQGVSVRHPITLDETCSRIESGFPVDWYWWCGDSGSRYRWSTASTQWSRGISDPPSFPPSESVPLIPTDLSTVRWFAEDDPDHHADLLALMQYSLFETAGICTELGRFVADHQTLNSIRILRQLLVLPVFRRTIDLVISTHLRDPGERVRDIPFLYVLPGAPDPDNSVELDLALTQEYGWFLFSRPVLDTDSFWFPLYHLYQLASSNPPDRRYTLLFHYPVAAIFQLVPLQAVLFYPYRWGVLSPDAAAPRPFSAFHILQSGILIAPIVHGRLGPLRSVPADQLHQLVSEFGVRTPGQSPFRFPVAPLYYPHPRWDHYIFSALPIQRYRRSAWQRLRIVSDLVSTMDPKELQIHWSDSEWLVLLAVLPLVAAVYESANLSVSQGSLLPTNYEHHPFVYMTRLSTPHQILNFPAWSDGPAVFALIELYRRRPDLIHLESLSQKEILLHLLNGQLQTWHRETPANTQQVEGTAKEAILALAVRAIGLVQDTLGDLRQRGPLARQVMEMLSRQIPQLISNLGRGSK